VNALSKPEVGKFINDHFVSSFQKISSFRIIGAQKQGGNVASYFCLPDGRVLHAIAGPVDSVTMLREARWVLETWKLAQLQSGQEGDAATFLAAWRNGHAERLRLEYGIDSKHVNPSLANVDLQAILAERSASGKARNIRGQRPLDNQGKVHIILAAHPLVRLERVYSVVFENILNQKLSTIPVVEKG
jgi:hypothetical protein